MVPSGPGPPVVIACATFLRIGRASGRAPFGPMRLKRNGGALAAAARATAGAAASCGSSSGSVSASRPPRASVSSPSPMM